MISKEIRKEISKRFEHDHGKEGRFGTLDGLSSGCLFCLEMKRYYEGFEEGFKFGVKEKINIAWHEESIYLKNLKSNKRS